MQHIAIWARSALQECSRGIPQACCLLHPAPWLPLSLQYNRTITTSLQSSAADESQPVQARPASAAAWHDQPPAVPTPTGSPEDTTQSTTTTTSPQEGSSSRPAGSPAETSGSPAQPSSSPASGMAFGTRQITRRQQSGRETLQGIVHINNTMNNILLALTDLQGNVKISKSAGNVGFRNARKSQPAAAEKVAEAVAQGALKLGYGSVVVRMKGVGPHKQLAAQMLHSCGLKITELQEVTPIPYNGCRLSKRRRI